MKNVGIHLALHILNYFKNVVPPSVSPPIEVVTSYYPGAPDRFVIDHHEESNQVLPTAAQNTLGGAVTANSLNLPSTGSFPGLTFDEYPHSRPKKYFFVTS